MDLGVPRPEGAQVAPADVTRWHPDQHFTALESWTRQLSHREATGIFIHRCLHPSTPFCLDEKSLADSHVMNPVGGSPYTHPEPRPQPLPQEGHYDTWSRFL